MFSGKVISLSIFLLVTCETICQEESPIVETSTGKVQGIITKSRKGHDIFSFYGIRYAEPPLNENRFKPPIPAKKWNGVYKAHIGGQACLSIINVKNLTFSEDCLFLDVYTTNLNASRPVIVFIHTGSFIFLSKNLASPEYMLDKDVVLVSINYRLGVFGYFSIGSKDASGNQGFKDQILALKWVRDNIKAFGGNPDLVTLCGHSAGSFSVSLHMLSKQSVGLFHRAIAMSGSGVAFTESTNSRHSNFIIFRTGCFRFSKAKTVECLQKLPANYLVKISKEILSFLPWYYSVENENDDQPFLTEKPIDIARRGEIQKVPLMTGFTSDEYFFLAYELNKRLSIFLTLFSVPLHNVILPYALMYDQYPNKHEVSSTIYSFYLHDKPISSSNLQQLGFLISDGGIRHGIHRLVELTRHLTDVYYYRFDYQSRYSIDYYPDGHPLGVLHLDDLQFTLVVKRIAPVADANDPRNFMIDRMTSWWAKFAETGNPNDRIDNATNDVIWELSDGNAIRTMYINETCKVSSEPYMQEFKLWDSLFPLYEN